MKIFSILPVRSKYKTTKCLKYVKDVLGILLIDWVLCKNPPPVLRGGFLHNILNFN